MWCMKTNTTKLIMIFFSIIFLCQCVSVRLAKKEVEAANNYKIANPSKPFELMGSPFADLSWKSTKTSSVIAVQTECTKGLRSISTVETDYIQSIEDARVIYKKNIENKNKIEFSQMLAVGKNENKDLKLMVNTYQKENCNYSLLYFSEPINFDSEVKYFESFINSFEVQ